MRQININGNNNGDKFAKIEEIKSLMLGEYKRIAIMGSIFLALLFITMISSSVLNDKKKDMKSEYDKYVTSLYTETNTHQSLQKEKVVLPAENAVDSDKINSDIETAEAFWKDIFDFSNGKEYDESRNKLIKMFGEKSEIVSNCFAENTKETVDGEEFNMVDMYEINMDTKDVTTYPLDIEKDGNNKYVSFISFTMNTVNSNTVANMLAVFYTVDEYDSIIDASSYLLNNSSDY